MPKTGVVVEDKLPEGPLEPSPHVRRIRRKNAELVVQRQREAATAEHVADTIKASLEAAALAIPVGIGVWIGTRLARPIGHSDLRGDPNNVIYPGVKAYIADSVGLLVGPAIAPALPKMLHDNGIAIANAYEAYFLNSTDQEGVDIVTKGVRGDGWFSPVFGPASDVDIAGGNPFQLQGVVFQTDVLVMLTLLFTAGLVAIPEIVKAFAKAVP